MNSVNPWGFYAIGGIVKRLILLTPTTPLAECHAILFDAEGALNFLLYNEQMIPLEDCRVAGNAL